MPGYGISSPWITLEARTLFGFPPSDKDYFEEALGCAGLTLTPVQTLARVADRAKRPVFRKNGPVTIASMNRVRAEEYRKNRRVPIKRKKKKRRHSESFLGKRRKHTESLKELRNREETFFAKLFKLEQLLLNGNFEDGGFKEDFQKCLKLYKEVERVPNGTTAYVDQQSTTSLILRTKYLSSLSKQIERDLVFLHRKLK
jgi:hypothetical protein